MATSWKGERKRSTRGKVGPVILITALIYLLLCLPSFAQNLRIYHIDVEQADATLIVSPSGRALLIDSGKNGHGTRLKETMDQAGVSQIDYFVSTHYHEDHYGGIDELVNLGVGVGTSYDRGDKDFLPAKKRNETAFKDYLGAVGNHAVPLTRGETIPLDPEMSVTCIATGGVVLGEENPVPGEDENDMSIALLIQYGGFRYFIGGDIVNTTEGKIASRDLVMDVDVYQADHHGSNTSSSEAFMQDLSPSVIVISNGNHGTYMHPRQYTLNLYAGLDTQPQVFQTNKYLKGGLGGNVKDDFIADPETIDSDGTILLTVNKDAGNFNVSYRDKILTFQTKQRSSPDTILVESLLPDPIGSDLENEEVTLRNAGASPVSMEGWVLQDKSGRIWTLVSLGTIEPGQSGTIHRNGMPMSLNNDGDEIFLRDASNQVRDQFQYHVSEEGTMILTNHR